MEKTNKNKTSLFFYNNRYIFLSLICTVAVLMVAFIAFGLFPFGDITILRMDLYHQYGPMFAELYDRITSGGSLAYSWNTGLGGSFLGNYFNYLSSPIGFVVMLLAGHKNIPEAIAVMVIIKAALAAAAFSFYLKKSQHKSNCITAGFSVFYAFCGWFLAYYWNIMWIDAMILLPLITLGIERIINNGKPVLYGVSLALSLFSNYYMSFMLCIFSVLYFIVYFCSNNITPSFKKFIKCGLYFAGASFAAAGIMAFALLPTYSILQQTSATSGSIPSDTSFYFTAFDFLSNHLSSVTPTIRSSGDDVMPNVYCGLLTVMLIPLYFMTKSISLKEKVLNLSLLGIFFLSFNINFLNYFWHGMHFPNDLPYRQSFIYSFLLLVIAFKTFTRLREIPNRFIALSAFGVVALTVLAEELESKNVTKSTVLWSFIFAVIYAVLIVVMKDKRFQFSAVSFLLLCCMCSESIICDTSKYSMDQPKANYAGDYDTFQFVKKYIDENETDEFYRMELSYLRTRMDPAWYNYNGISTFSSMAYESVAALHRKLGMYGNNINSYTYYPQTAIYNSLFSLKYIVNNLAEDVFSESKLLENVYSLDKFTVYKNKYALPLAYVVDDSITEWNWENSNPFTVQNDLFYRACGEENALVKLSPYNIYNSNMDQFVQPLTSETFPFSKGADFTATSTFSYVTEKAGDVYLYVSTGEGSDSGTMTVTTDENTLTQDLSKGYILDIGWLDKGENFTVEIPLKNENGTLTVYCYTLDSKKYVRGCENLKTLGLEYTKFTDTEIEGTYAALEDSVLMTTIPYDTGWNIYIDGKKIDEDNIVKIGDALIGIKTTRGEHTLKMEYIPDGLKTGIVISIVTALLLAAALIIHLIRKRRGRTGDLLPFDDSFDSELFYPVNYTDAPLAEEFKTKSEHKIQDKNKPDDLKIFWPYPPTEREVISPSHFPVKEIIDPETAKEEALNDEYKPMPDDGFFDEDFEEFFKQD